MIFLSLSACFIFVDNDPQTCEEVRSDFDRELDRITSCTADAECGQVLTGTSCGCTRDIVARVDADPALARTLMNAAEEQECDLGLTSVCDCPEAFGFECAAGTCAWDYADGTWLPDCQAERGDGYTVTAAEIDGDTLTATVSHSGGCATHAWQLCWPDGMFAESSPVQASLEIWHDDGGDSCDAMLSEDVDFDLAPLAAAWNSFYGPGPGTIVVHVGEFDRTYIFGG